MPSTQTELSKSYTPGQSTRQEAGRTPKGQASLRAGSRKWCPAIPQQKGLAQVSASLLALGPAGNSEITKLAKGSKPPCRTAIRGSREADKGSLSAIGRVGIERRIDVPQVLSGTLLAMRFDAIDTRSAARADSHRRLGVVDLGPKQSSTPGKPRGGRNDGLRRLGVFPPLEDEHRQQRRTDRNARQHDVGRRR